MSKKAIETSIRTGHWFRLRHGTYTFAEAWQALTELERHLVRAKACARTAKTKVVISHTSAAIAHGMPLWDVDLTHVHLTRTDGRTGRLEAGVDQHRGKLRSDESVEVNGVLVTSAMRTVIDLMALLDTEHSLPTVDAAFRSGVVDLELLEADLETKRFWPGTNNAIIVTRLADGRAGSIAESRTRHLCWRYGLPRPEIQYDVRTPDGRLIGTVDLAWPEYGVFVEFDGRIKYDQLVPEGKSALDVILAEKRRSELICERTGWICIRLTWADLGRPQATANRIRAALRARQIA